MLQSLHEKSLFLSQKINSETLDLKRLQSLHEISVNQEKQKAFVDFFKENQEKTIIGASVYFFSIFFNFFQFFQ